MRLALIRAGVVENVILAADDYQALADVQAIETDVAGPGWTYEAGAFAPPVPAVPAHPAVPVEVWTYQAKTVMSLTTLGSLGLDGAVFGLNPEASLYDAVEAAIEGLPEQIRIAAQIQLAGAPGTRRDAPLLAALSGPLGLTSEMIDQLFIAAAAIP
ncbi:hypothetical protein [Brevundimonas sp.]|uniref:hypothetical protein n=1 Tax=Brevundimonas sp. TaxID=1871086 RepID=UPI00286C245F|nr:hypothetical protein [Brevundimonas sp.]